MKSWLKVTLLVLLGIAVGTTGLLALGIKWAYDAEESLSRDKVLIALNERRLQEGLPQVGESLGLQSIAEKRAETACVDEWIPSHEGLREMVRDGMIPEELLGKIGEIIAANINSAQEAIEIWESSPTHRDLMLSRDLRSVWITPLGNCVVVLLQFN